MDSLPVIYRFLVTAFAVIALSGCGSTGAGGDGAGGNDPVSAQVHRAVNSYRASKGKSSLTRHSGLDALAMKHSRYLMSNSGKFSLHGTMVSHEGFEGRVLAAKRIYSMSSLSENVAAATLSGSGAGNSLVAMWKRSKAHHDNMLEDWTHTGIGSVRSSTGTIYSTQLFATKEIGLTPLRDRMTQGY